MAPPDSTQWLLADRLAVPAGDPDRLRGLDGDARGGLPRAARVLRRALARAPRSLLARKFFYLFTCEYCFSHYVTVFFLILTRYRLLLDDWRGT